MKPWNKIKWQRANIVLANKPFADLFKEENEMRNKRSPKLSAILDDLLTDACANWGHAFSHPLKGGLTVSVKVARDDICYLAIPRVDKAPGAEEWKTVIRDIGAPAGTTFVERTPEPKHTPYQHRAEPLRVYLVGEWALQPALSFAEG